MKLIEVVIFFFTSAIIAGIWYFCFNAPAYFSLAVGVIVYELFVIENQTK